MPRWSDYAYCCNRHVTPALHLLHGGNVSPFVSGIVLRRPTCSHETHVNTPDTGFFSPVRNFAPIGVRVVVIDVFAFLGLPITMTESRASGWSR